MSPLKWLPLVLGAAAASSAQAEPLTFDQALARADRTAPSLQARALEVQAAQSAARAAGRLPDPRLKLGVDNYPVSGPVAGRFSADEMTMTRVGIMQDVPNGGARRAAVDRARSNMMSRQSPRRFRASVPPWPSG